MVRMLVSTAFACICLVGCQQSQEASGCGRDFSDLQEAGFETGSLVVAASPHTRDGESDSTLYFGQLFADDSVMTLAVCGQGLEVFSVGEVTLDDVSSGDSYELIGVLEKQSELPTIWLIFDRFRAGDIAPTLLLSVGATANLEPRSVEYVWDVRSGFESAPCPEIRGNAEGSIGPHLIACGMAVVVSWDFLEDGTECSIESPEIVVVERSTGELFGSHVVSRPAQSGGCMTELYVLSGPYRAVDVISRVAYSSGRPIDISFMEMTVRPS